MTLTLRGYQAKANDAAKEWHKKSIEPAITDAAPAAGKSYLIADLASWFINSSNGKRVLVLQPNKDLLEQNFEKFMMTGEKASIFSASAGSKSTRHKTVFATPLTVKNSMSRFTKGGDEGFCAVIIDEAHEITPTIQVIIAEMRRANPNLRVHGFTGTPYRLGTGYIYQIDHEDKAVDESQARDPYFMKCVYRVSAHEMLDEKFITPMKVLDINASAYDTSGITLLPNGTPNPSDVERAFVGHGRETAAIVADVIAQANSLGVKGGIMYFAATVRHAEEIMASLPPNNSAMTTGDKAILNGVETSHKEVVKAYREGRVRHLTSVGKLTTGFDVSHTVIIALLRYTESASLLTQIMGRAWRLNDAKPQSYLLDYAGNVERHFPDGDIYNPKIEVSGKGGGGTPIEVECPDCHTINNFTLNPDYVDYVWNENGYAKDVFGELLQSEHGPVSVHYGRRCFGVVPVGKGRYDRCNYRWTGRECGACGEINDPCARYCYVCKAEIIDPNRLLVTNFTAMKRDPYQVQCDKVLSVKTSESVSSKGNETLRVDFETPHRKFSVWYMPKSDNAKFKSDYNKWLATGGNPSTVSYLKDKNSGFFRVMAYDMPTDEDELPETVRAMDDIKKVARR